MKGKKKNLMIDRGLDSDYVPPYILPKGYRAACHLHKEILLFKTIDDCMKHNNEKHDYRKINVL
jgi:hypothetical protein